MWFGRQRILIASVICVKWMDPIYPKNTKKRRAALRKHQLCETKGENLLQLLMCVHFLFFLCINISCAPCTTHHHQFNVMLFVKIKYKVLHQAAHTQRINNNEFQDNESFSNLIWQRIYYSFRTIFWLAGWLVCIIKTDPHGQMNRLNYRASSGVCVSVCGFVWLSGYKPTFKPYNLSDNKQWAIDRKTVINHRTCATTATILKMYESNRFTFTRSPLPFFVNCPSLLW